MFTQMYTGEYYHLFNRGVDKRNIFLDDQDKNFFLHRLRQYLLENDEELVELDAYCLMDNHFHLLLRQQCENGITRYSRRLFTSYVKYFNKKYDRKGRLFETQIKRKYIGTDGYLARLIRYIHLNPRDILKDTADVAESLKGLIDYQWSDMKDYINGQGKLSDFFNDLSYRDFVLAELAFPKCDFNEGWEV